MHAHDEGANSTLCGLVGLHHWPALDFPRAYGTHCDACSDELARAARQARGPAD